MYINKSTKDRSLNTLALQCAKIAETCQNLASQIVSATAQCEPDLCDVSLDLVFMDAAILNTVSSALSDLTYNLENQVEEAIHAHNEALEEVKRETMPRNELIGTEMEL